MTYLTDRITVEEGLCNGKPTIRGMRITAQRVLEFLKAGDTRADILYQYPMLEEADIDACLDFAIKMIDHQYAIIPMGKVA
jgi:uncharacterized protein (DUF433 family)